MRPMRHMNKLLAFILFFLISTSTANAEELMKVRIANFEGGQNSYDLSDVININQGQTLSNVINSKKGQLFKRKGQSLFAGDESNTAWTGIGRYDPGINTSYIMAASGVRIVKSESSPASWIVINNATYGGGSGFLTDACDTEFIQANDLLFILNGTDYTSFFDNVTFNKGTNATGSPPVATTAAWLRNYLFTAGDPTHTDWVSFSNNLVPYLFTSTDVFRVNTGDGQVIQRIEVFRLNELIIYKERSIFVLDITGTTPLTDWTLQPISKVIGCIAKRSVVNFGNDQWFLSSDPIAVRSLSRTSYDKILTEMVSQPIQDIFDGTGERVINKTYIDKACGVFFDNKYLLAIATGASSVNDFVVVYDFLTKSWSTIDGWYPSAWVVWDNSLFYTDALDGRVIECFEGTQGDMASGPVITTASEPTVSIPYSYISKTIDFDNKENYKQLDSIEVIFDPSGSYNATLYINLDGNGWQNVGTINLAGSAPVLPLTLPFTLSSSGMARKTFQLQRYGEFRKIQIKITQSGASEECNLQSVCCFATLKPWRRE